MLALTLLGCETDKTSIDLPPPDGAVAEDAGVPGDGRPKGPDAGAPGERMDAQGLGGDGPSGPDARVPDGAGSMKIPFDLQRWVYEPQRTSVRASTQFPGEQELVQTGGLGTLAYLKDFQFTDGTLEVDLVGGYYLGLAFRVQPQQGNAEPRGESLYVRVEKNEAEGTAQSFPLGTGESDDTFFGPPLDGPVPLIPQGQWFHLRIDVEGRQLKVFMNRSAQPVHVVDMLHYAPASGSIGLRSWGGSFANLRVTVRKP